MPKLTKKRLVKKTFYKLKTLKNPKQRISNLMKKNMLRPASNRRSFRQLVRKLLSVPQD